MRPYFGGNIRCSQFAILGNEWEHALVRLLDGYFKRKFPKRTAIIIKG